jgi:hypothetical protein
LARSQATGQLKSANCADSGIPGVEPEQIINPVYLSLHLPDLVGFNPLDTAMQFEDRIPSYFQDLRLLCIRVGVHHLDTELLIQSSMVWVSEQKEPVAFPVRSHFSVNALDLFRMKNRRGFGNGGPVGNGRKGRRAGRERHLCGGQV